MKEITLEAETEEKKYGIFTPPVEAEKIFGVCGVVKRLKNSPKIYAPNELRKLLRQNNEKDTTYGTQYTVVRFLVSENRGLFFAKEGYPYNDVPAHYQMAHHSPYSARCITTGNAYFDQENNLCILDHKSGDFRPSFNSLQFMLDACVQNKIKLNNTVEIKELDRKGREIKSHLYKNPNSLENQSAVKSAVKIMKKLEPQPGQTKKEGIAALNIVGKERLEKSKEVRQESSGMLKNIIKFLNAVMEGIKFVADVLAPNCMSSTFFRGG